MPELPEVERGRKIAASVAEGRRIQSLKISPDEIVFQGVTPTTWNRALVGTKVLEVRRRGKQLWFETDGKKHPLFHFGMTGAFHTPDSDHLKLATGPQERDPDWPPRFWKIHLVFDDGGELCMTNARRLGRILLRENPEEEPPISRLGFDPLTNMPSDREFSEKLRRRKAAVKALLLDQSFCAGIGNWIADEVLYQAGIDPRRRGSELSIDEAIRIQKALAAIVKQAVRVDADKNQLPDDWLFHHRWGKQKACTTSRGEAIEHLTIGGRTTAWVPGRQN